MKTLAILLLATAVAVPVAGLAQTSQPADLPAQPLFSERPHLSGPAQTSQAPDPLGWKGKLKFHAKKTIGPEAILGMAAYAAVLQEMNAPEEWKQGGGAYAKRVASMAGWSGIHGALAFGLDTTLHQDPRYYRSGVDGFWRRTGHAVRGTILTRTDSGGETLSTWRLGSDYGSAFLSNLWYPDRVNNFHLGVIQGSISLGLDVASNIASEFWPDVKRKLFHKKATP